MQWRAVRVANRMRLLRFLPGTQIVAAHGAIAWRALGWRSFKTPDMLIYVGTPGLTQKAVIHLVEPGSPGYGLIVKAPLAAGARDAIIREATILTEISAERPGCAPQLIRIYGERGISSQEFLRGRPGGRRLKPEYLELLRSLVLPDEYTTFAAHVQSWQAEGSPWLPSRFDLDLVRSAYAELDDAHPLPACWLHGDFAPWNIRERPGQTPAMIDWEDASRGGLPLQDSYHFLHIQDYLFGSSPKLHAADLLSFGKGLGISAQQCRRLEIAYLTRSYLLSLSRGDARRTEFLSRALTRALRDSIRPISSPAASRSPSRPLPMRPANTSTARRELLGAVLVTLEAEAVPYCVLSGYPTDGGSGFSDLDIMIRRADFERMPDLLSRAANSAGASLAQSIQHETTGHYFVLARLERDRVGYLDVDCYSDYRRDGRTWMLADTVVSHRRKHRDVYLPGIADEFTYYLLKKVLKQEITGHHLKRLQHLLARSPLECRQRLARFWPATALQLERAVASHDLNCIREQFPILRRQLQNSVPVEGPGRRFTGHLREICRRLRRAIHATGLWVNLSGGDREQREEIAAELVTRLAPLFRRTSFIPFADSLKQLPLWPIRLLAARMRSTLVLTCEPHDSFPGKQFSVRDLARPVIGLARLPDLQLVLQSEACGPTAARGKTVCLNSSGSADEILQAAGEAVLHLLTQRTATRHTLTDPAAGQSREDARAISPGNIELTVAGSD